MTMLDARPTPEPEPEIAAPDRPVSTELSDSQPKKRGWWGRMTGG